MNRENFNHQLDEKVFTFQNNGSLQTDEDSIGLTNEHSNLLCSRFLPGFKVIGHKYDGLKKRVIFFLTNPETKVSQIGQIKFNTEIQEVSDIERQCGCDFEVILNDPLEKQEQLQHCKYETIVEDSCNLCLNFSIDYPIHNIEIRHEQSGSIIYWTDGYNPYRYMELDFMEKYTERNIPCVTESEKICFDCEKLRVFTLFDKPGIKASSVEYGGNLKRGNYHYKIAYCDSQGNELTDYFNGTGRVTIFDKSENILDQPQYADPTKFAIKLDIFDLDNRFDYYCIAVVYFDPVSGGAYQAYKMSPTPITVNTVVHSSTVNLEKTSLEKLNSKRPIYETVDGLTTSNNYIIPYGLKEKRTWNLQPISNLLGFFLKWQTVMARENLYEDGVNDANYGSYMRNETYPFAFRFVTKDGYTSPLTPLISRPPNEYDLEELSKNNEDVKSVNRNLGCNTIERTKRYQLYNTATKDLTLDCPQAEIKGKTVSEEIEEFSIFNVHEEQPGTLTLNPDGEFEDLKEWVNNNKGLLINPETHKENNDHKKLSDIINVTYVDTHKTAEMPFPICNEDCPTGTCDTPELDEEYESSIDLKTVINPTYKRIEKNFPEEYSRTQLESCEMYYRDKSKPVIDTDMSAETIVLGPDDDISYMEETQLIEFRPKIASNVRNKIEGYSDCGNTIPIGNVEEAMPVVFDVGYKINKILGGKSSASMFKNKILFDGVVSYMNDVLKEQEDKGEQIKNLLLKIPAEYTSDVFKEYLHKNAIWFSQTFEEEELMFEVTPGLDCCRPDFYTSANDIVRYHIFDGCKKVVDSGTIDLNEGKLFRLKRSDFKSQKVYLVLDTPIEVKEQWGEIKFEKSEKLDGGKYKLFVLTSNRLCFKVLKRTKEYSNVEITHEGITFEKTEKYTSLCRFTVPELDNCEPQVYSQGDFAYTESTEIYPDNPELFDSSFLKINRGHFDKLKEVSEIKHIDKFIDFFTDGEDKQGNFIWRRDEYGKPMSDFTCRNIRHFKFPDNAISPMMNTIPLTRFDESIIYPMGVNLNENIINAFLDIAVDNNLLTKQERDSISHFELFRGLRTENNKSVMYKGIASDMYKDPVDTDTYFRNFPYNALGKNKLFVDNQGKDIPHPYDSEKNNRFSLISPEVYLDKRVLGTEVYVEGYMYGNSIGNFHKVKNHSKWVILGRKSRDKARTLAMLEVAFELAMFVTEQIVTASSSMWFIAGVSTGGGVAGKIASGVAIAAYTIAHATNSLYKHKRYYDQWIKSFKDLGSPINFAHYYLSPKGYYNRLVPNKEEGNKLRTIVKAIHLKPGVPTTNEEGKYIRINNRSREDSLYISFGEKGHLNYPSNYIKYDNADTSPNNTSRYVASDYQCSSIKSSVRRIASPYFSINRYVPDQYGRIYNIAWVYIPYKGDLTTNRECKTAFGGDIRISRVDLKNKVPIFIADAVGLANRLPFEYSEYFNIAKPKYYVDYETGTEGSGLFKGLPTQESVLKMDCQDKRGLYVKAPSKFYLYYYGIPYFLVESEINNHYRVAGKEPHENFASNGIDVEEWTQQDNVNIDRQNIYKYSRVYDAIYLNEEYYQLPHDYSRKKAKKLTNYPNDAIISMQDNNEMTYSNPWLVYKPFNRIHFNTDYGKLINMKPLESNMVLCLFENQAAVFNAVDKLRDRLSKENAELGLNGVFSQRPVEFHRTELGETGTQHKAFVSTEFGHFWVDAERGKVNYIAPNGSGLTAVSDFKKNGQESGMRKWFKKYLPFQITKVEGLDYINVDNAYKDVGIVMWWDSKFKRVFITKKDYKPLNNCIEWSKDYGFYINKTKCNGEGEEITCQEGYSYNPDTRKCEKRVETTPQCPPGFKLDLENQICVKEGKVECPDGYTLENGVCVSKEEETVVKKTEPPTETPRQELPLICRGTMINGKCIVREEVEPVYNINRTKIDVKDKRYFKDVSWTVAYSPIYDSWISYYDFKPNYAIAYPNYFQTGINYSNDNNEVGLWSHLLTNKSFQVFYGKFYNWTIEYPIKNEYTNNILESISIWGRSYRYHNEIDYAEYRKKMFNEVIVYNHTNNSGILHLDYVDRLNHRNYPKTLDSVSQKIAAVDYDEQLTFNYFFNRVLREDFHVPIWLHDDVNINKEINPKAVRMGGKRVLERMRGDWFLTRLTQNKTSQLKHVFKWQMADTDLY